MLIYFLLPLIAVALLCVPFIFTAKKIKNGRSPKGAFIGNLCTFAGIMLCALIVPVGNFVSAASEEGVKAALSTGAGLGYLAAALAVGLSCVGSGIAVAAGAPAAIGATSEDPYLRCSWRRYRPLWTSYRYPYNLKRRHCTGHLT